MRVALAADHGGAALKGTIIEALTGRPRSGQPFRSKAHSGRELELQVIDLGGDGGDPADDYPDYCVRLGEALRGGRAERGILVCGSGIGASIAASKMAGIRAGVAHDCYSARQGVEHDDMNVLCLGARVIGAELAIECVWAFLGARFSGADRHARRLAKVAEIEATELAGASVLNRSPQAFGSPGPTRVTPLPGSPEPPRSPEPRRPDEPRRPTVR